MFQFKLKRQGIILTLWEIFQFFEYLNTTHKNVYYEPQRYHQISFELLYKFVTNEDYQQRVDRLIQEKNQVRASVDSVFNIAQEINQKKKKGMDSSEEGLYSDSNREEEEEVVFSNKNKKNVVQDVTFDRKK